MNQIDLLQKYKVSPRFALLLVIGYRLLVIGLFSHPLLVIGYRLLVIGLFLHPLLGIGTTSMERLRITCALPPITDNQ